MFDSARFLIFLSAAFLLAVAPGPGMLHQDYRRGNNKTV